MRLRYLPLLLIVAFTILVMHVSGVSTPDSFEANKEMIVLRKIGHEILLNAGDSHSRILPVKKISDQEFRVSFENPVALMPDSAAVVSVSLTTFYDSPFSIRILPGCWCFSR